MTDDLDAALAAHSADQEAAVSVTPSKLRRHRHVWGNTLLICRVCGSMVMDVSDFLRSDHPHEPLRSTRCLICQHERSPERSRRGRQSRNYGNRAELDIARTYGGTKVGHHGGPVDVRGAHWHTQVKTHRREPPLEWREAFAKLDASADRLPRLLLRFVHPGKAPEDFIVVPGKAWREWYGRDEEE